MATLLGRAIAIRVVRSIQRPWVRCLRWVRARSRPSTIRGRHPQPEAPGRRPDPRSPGPARHRRVRSGHNTRRAAAFPPTRQSRPDCPVPIPRPVRLQPRPASAGARLLRPSWGSRMRSPGEEEDVGKPQAGGSAARSTAAAAAIRWNRPGPDAWAGWARSCPAPIATSKRTPGPAGEASSQFRRSILRAPVVPTRRRQRPTMVSQLRSRRRCPRPDRLGRQRLGARERRSVRTATGILLGRTLPQWGFQRWRRRARVPMLAASAPAISPGHFALTSDRPAIPILPTERLRHAPRWMVRASPGKVRFLIRILLRGLALRWRSFRPTMHPSRPVR